MPSNQPLNQREALLAKIIEVISEVYGNDPEELSAASDLNEDVGLLNSPQEFTLFVATLNDTFDIDLDPRRIMEHCQEGDAKLQGLVYIVEDAELG